MESFVPSPRSAFLLFTAVLVATFLGSVAMLRAQSAAATWENHTREALASIERTLSTLKDAETAQRGFLLTDDVRFLEPYNGAVATLHSTLGALQESTQHNVSQTRTLVAVQSDVKETLAELGQTIALHASGKPAAAVAIVRSGRGKLAMDRLRMELGAMQIEEERLLAERSARASRTRAWTLVTVSALAGVALGLLWLLRELMQRHAARIRMSEERLATTIISVGDAVIATDVHGFIERMNPVAEHLTGWNLAEASGQPLDVVFCIVNEYTRQPVESPLQKVLKEGRVVGLANHTVLVAKDGSERLIEDSVAPIRGKDGSVAGVVLVFKDATERYAAERALANSEARFRTLADHIPQLAWIADAATEGEVNWFNKGWLEYTGSSLEQMRGTGWKSVHHPDFVEQVAQKFAYHVREGLDWEDTFPLRGKDGQYRWFLSRMNAIRDDTGRVVQIFGTNTDITAQRQMEEELRRLASELSDADRRKDEFLATLAHELRNPLAPIRNAVRLLGPDTPRTSQVQARSIIERQSAQMARLLDDLLDMSRITRGVIELRLEVIDLHGIIDDVVLANRALLERLHHQLSVNAPTVPLMVEADPTRLHQILDNLLQNAAKYTDPGGQIEISASDEREAIILCVTDSGIGLAPDSLDRVFDLFAQVDTPMRRHSGLGIGLAVVRRIVILHGGSVHAESAGLGMGSRFRVRLPKATRAARAEPAAENPENQPAPSTPSPRVLVVDDQPDIVNSLTLVLRGRGYSVHGAEDGVAALQVAENLRPDVMVVDLGMPKMDGYQVARWVRQQPWGGRTRLIAVTGWGQDADRRRSADSGFDHHLVKPVDPEALVSLLNSSNRPA